MIKLELQERFKAQIILGVCIYTFMDTYVKTHIYLYLHAVGHITNWYLSVLGQVYKYLYFCNSTCWGMWAKIQSLGIWDNWMCSLFLCGWAYGFQLTHKYISSQLIYPLVSHLKADPPDIGTLQVLLLRKTIKKITWKLFWNNFDLQMKKMQRLRYSNPMLLKLYS